MRLNLDMLTMLGTGNTTYEELERVSYDVDRGQLKARVRIKNGADAASSMDAPREHVGFWLWADGGWVHLGTATTLIDSAAALRTVSLGVELGHFRASPARFIVRAILSWNIDPSLLGPNYCPVWGNHKDAVIVLGRESPGPRAH